MTVFLTFYALFRSLTVKLTDARHDICTLQRTVHDMLSGMLILVYAFQFYFRLQSQTKKYLLFLNVSIRIIILKNTAGVKNWHRIFKCKKRISNTKPYLKIQNIE